jgi:hypothetical protein
VEQVTSGNEMTKEQAETLYKIRGNRVLLQNEQASNSRFHRLDAFQVTSAQLLKWSWLQARRLQKEEFYQLHRWIKCLKEAKHNGQLNEYTDKLIEQMEARMHIFPLSPRDQKALWTLSLLPESTLSKYDRGHKDPAGLLAAWFNFI